METDAPPHTYALVQRVLHWAIALCVIALLAAGIAMNNVAPGPLMNGLYVLHWSLGVVVFPLAVLQIIARFTHATPAFPETLPAWQCFAARANYALLYAILLVNPVLGYLTKSAFGGPVTLFWLVDLPPLMAKNEALFERLSSAHGLIGFVMLAAVALHILAALHHGIILRDGVLSQMTFGASAGKQDK